VFALTPTHACDSPAIVSFVVAFVPPLISSVTFALSTRECVPAATVITQGMLLSTVPGS